MRTARLTDALSARKKAVATYAGTTVAHLSARKKAVATYAGTTVAHLSARKKAVATYAGAAVALLGAGGAVAGAVAPHGHAPAHHEITHAVAQVAPISATSHGVSAHVASAVSAAKPAAGAGAVKAQAAVTTAAVKTAAVRTVAVKTVAAKTAAARTATARPATPGGSWTAAQAVVARQTSPSEPRADDQLTPAGTAGTQTWMPISDSQMGNATTIVQQALQKKMGVRSAVIAVATAMQESQLTNINYGDQDSLGLFQQRPSMGWGSSQQILNPKHAADSFLTALQEHQIADPGWVHQSLWANAQAVQASGFPFAYAKWESQAAHLVKQIVTQVA